MNIHQVDLRLLNSMTKYPSIPTYHAMGEKGRLLDKVEVSFEGEPEIIVTEKVDGTNARVILLPNKHFIIGSREELLYYQGDVLFNPALGIVDAIRPTFDHWAGLGQHVQDYDYVSVYYGEVYGAGVGNGAKNYSGEGKTGFRLFDVAGVEGLQEKLKKTPEEIARWRDAGGQAFNTESGLQFLSRDVGRTPLLKVTKPLPTAIPDVYEWLMEVCPRSQCTLDGKASARPEGVVVRTPDRSKIAKIRFEDYERTARVRQKDVASSAASV